MAFKSILIKDNFIKRLDMKRLLSQVANFEVNILILTRIGGEAFFVLQEKVKSPPLFSNLPMEPGHKVHACSLRFSALK